MASVINHNIPALTSQRFLGVNNRAAEKSMARLASGLKINSAADDAAGLAISEKMRGQVRGLDMAKKNAQDTSSLIQVAEGALDQMHAILGRMRELTVQAANDTNTDDDRNEIEGEIKQLKKEIDRIGNSTEFNTKKLLDGSLKGAKDSVKGRLIINNNSQVTFNAISQLEAIQAVQQAGIYDGMITIIRNSTESNVNSWKVIFNNDVDVKGNSVAVTGYGSNGELIQAGSGDNGYGQVGQSGAQAGVAYTSDMGAGFKAYTNITVFVAADGKSITISNIVNYNGTFTNITLVLASGGILFTDVEVGEGISFNFARSIVDKGTLDQSLMTQLGANTGQVTYASIGDMRSRALGLEYTSVASNEKAQAAIAEVDNATVRVSSQRSLLGAIQNRMEYAVNALETTSENVAAAESRIRDTDMASEMSTYSKENIKSQAAQTMVAQANARAQQVLSLLQ
jgi:flagellin